MLKKIIRKTKMKVFSLKHPCLWSLSYTKKKSKFLDRFIDKTRKRTLHTTLIINLRFFIYCIAWKRRKHFFPETKNKTQSQPSCFPKTRQIFQGQVEPVFDLIRFVKKENVLIPITTNTNFGECWRQNCEVFCLKL